MMRTIVLLVGLAAIFSSQRFLRADEPVAPPATDKAAETTTDKTPEPTAGDATTGETPAADSDLALPAEPEAAPGPSMAPISKATSAARPLPLPPAVGQSPREREIEAALQKPVQLDVDSLSLAEACDKISKQVGVEIVLQKKALADASIDPAAIVTEKFDKPLPLAVALGFLDDFGLTYAVRNDVLVVTTPEIADTMTTTRVYGIDDLVRERERFAVKFAAAPDSATVRTPQGWALVHFGSRDSHVGIAEMLAEMRATKDGRRADADADVAAALNKPVTLDIHETSLEDAIRKLAEQSGVAIQIDRNALAAATAAAADAVTDAEADKANLITVKTNQPLALSAALQLILADTDLTPVVFHGRVQITSREKANSQHVSRAYLVGDLVNAAPGRLPKFDAVINMLQTVAPDSWVAGGGYGTIKPVHVPWGWLLVVTNRRSTQAEVASLLSTAGAARQTAEAIASPPAHPNAR